MMQDVRHSYLSPYYYISDGSVTDVSLSLIPGYEDAYCAIDYDGDQTDKLRQKLVLMFYDCSFSNYNTGFCQKGIKDAKSPSKMQTIKELYDQARRNGNHQVILSLSNQIKKVTQITTAEKPLDFVDTVIKDYSYYTQQL